MPRAAGMFCSLFLIFTTAAVAAGPVELVSRTDPSQASDSGSGAVSYVPSYEDNDYVTQPVLSADGRYLAFVSPSPNLVPGQRDANGDGPSGTDVFLRDLVAGTTTLVSHAAGSETTAGNSESGYAGMALSADGRYVAYVSRATDLAPGQIVDPDLENLYLILYDRAAGTNAVVVSTADSSAQFRDLALSADGRYFAFASDADALLPGLPYSPYFQIYLYDRGAGKLRLVDHKRGLPNVPADASSFGLRISADGRYVLFTNDSGGFAPGERPDDGLFLYDRVADAAVAVGPAPRQGFPFSSGALLSADGKYVAVGTPTPYFWSRETGQTTLATGITAQGITLGGLSADGRYALFQRRDSDNDFTLIVYDRVSRTFTAASRPSPGAFNQIGHTALSADGRYALFSDPAPNVIAGQKDPTFTWDVFLFDRVARKTTLVSHTASAALTVANAPSLSPVMSANGSRLAFSSAATNLVAGVRDLNDGLDLFAYTVPTRALEMVTHRAPALVPATADARSTARALSADGRWVVFESASPRLIAGQADANGKLDLFLYDRVAGKTALVTHAASAPLTTANTPVPQDYRYFQMTPDGRYVAYTSNAGDLVAGQAGTPVISLFLYDRVTGTNVLVSHKAGSAVTPGNQISGGIFRITDAGSVAFSSGATDLVSPGLSSNGAPNVFFWDRTSGKITLISRAAGAPNTAARGYSQSPWVSGDGRWIAFSSNAPDLVPGLTLSSSQGDVFLHDRATGKTALVSRANPAANAAAGNGSSHNPIVSTGGNYVLFTSRATNLVLGQKDTNSDDDAFLFERATGKTTLLSHAAGRATTAARGLSVGAAITPDGQWIVFGSNADDILPGQTETGRWNTADVFLYERATGKVLLASRAAASPVTAPDSDCSFYGLSADGRKVSFSSGADNLLAAGADTNGAEDAFVFDRVTGKTTLVSAVSPGVPGNGGSSGPLLSADGRWVGYTSEATNLAGRRRDTNGLSDVFLRETATGAARLVTLRPPALPSLTPRGKSLGWTVSADGRYVAFTSAAPDLVPGQVDANNNDDAFVYDRALGKTTLVSRSAASSVTTGNGIVYDVQISADGRFALYLSTSTNAVPGQEDVDDSEAFDLFLFELATGTTTLVTHAAGSPTRTGNHPSGLWAEMSGDATWIAYAGQATDLVAGQGEPSSPYDRNAFLYNRLTGETTLLSHRHDSALQPANAETLVSAISADGQVVLLTSRASDLIPPIAPDLDINGDDDVFVVDRSAGITTLISRTPATPPRAAGGRYPQMSRDGRMISFVSDGNDLVPGQIDGDRTGDLFLHDRQSGATALVSHAAGSPVIAVGAFGMALSGGGRWLAFTSEATDVVAGQTDANEGEDVFLYDRDTGTTRMVSHTAGTSTVAAGTRTSNLSSISDDGRYVAFLSHAADLVTGLTGPAYLSDNAYVWDRTTGANTLLTRSALFPGRYGNGDSQGAVFAAGGSGVIFSSSASDLVTGDYTLDPSGRSFQDVFFYPLP